MHRRRRRKSRAQQGLLVRFQAHVEIDKPHEEVFAFIADFTNVPKWNYYIRSVDKETEGPDCVGTRYSQGYKNGDQRFEITEYNPPHAVSIESLDETLPAFLMRYRLLQRGANRTLVTSTSELYSASKKLLARLSARRMKRTAAENLYKLKELLEEGSATLQDGRTMSR